MEGMRFSVPGGLGRLLSRGEIWVPARDKLDHSLINDYNRQLCSVGAPGVHFGGGVLSLSQNNRMEQKQLRGLIVFYFFL